MILNILTIILVGVRMGAAYEQQGSWMGPGPAPVVECSVRITISKELMLGCINKNSFRLLLISFQIVKPNDSCLPLCAMMIFSFSNKHYIYKHFVKTFVLLSD